MSDEVLSPDEQIIRDMGDEMNEIRVGRAKAYFQIRQLRTQLAKRDRRIAELETELRRWRGCPSCKEDHDDSVMCPPHEVRTSGRAWFHTQARRWAERAEELQVERDELIKEFGEFKQEQREYRDKILTERDELKRKLDACQCETRVLNESLLIEARQERDQLAAEAARLREVLEMIATIKLNESDPAFIGICPMRIGFLRPTHMSKVKEALASIPHAAKAAERVQATGDVVQEARHFYGHYGPLNDALDRLDALDKPQEATNDA